MRLTSLFLSTILLLSSLTVSAADFSYRVSGIVGQENCWLFAIVEDSEGSCRVYTKGDKLGSWTIVNVTPQGVIVDAAGETRFLKLEGNSYISKIETSDSVTGEDLPVITSTRPTQGKLTQQEMQLAVNNIADELEWNKQDAVEPQLLNAMLGFSPQTVIKAVNEKPVKHTREIVYILRSALTGTKPVEFTLSEGGEITKIYYQFSEPSTPHPHD